MNAEPGRSPRASAAAAEYERGAERLRATIAVALEPGAGFPAQLETALRAGFALFEAEPELARLLVVRPFEGDEGSLYGYERWRERAADLLRAAAARDPAAHVHPPFVEPALVSGICVHISRRLLASGSGGLEELLPGLLEFVFVCYYGAERADRLAHAR